MADLKPIKIWIMPTGPNPWKVILVLEELNIPYDINLVEFAKIKSKPFTNINPNGRNPAIHDPNTDLTLWESGAIIQYLIEQYDTEKKLTYTDLKQRHLLNQYLFFQVSGQGPYFGQAGWFAYLHHEKLPSAIERYQNETKRVLSVLEDILSKNESGWLVGDKCTFADLAFLPFNTHLEMFLGCESKDRFTGCPRVQAWHERMEGRETWKKCSEIRVKLMEQEGLKHPEKVTSDGEEKDGEEAIAKGA